MNLSPSNTPSRVFLILGSWVLFLILSLPSYGYLMNNAQFLSEKPLPDFKELVRNIADMELDICGICVLIYQVLLLQNFLDGFGGGFACCSSSAIIIASRSAVALARAWYSLPG